MPLKNVEIKARCDNPDRIRSVLLQHEADFKGRDHQVDTYFQVPEGRLKLREGTIEQNLIYYRRDDHRGPRTSDIDLVAVDEAGPLKKLLTHALEVMTVVDKQRDIYFIDNVKFHIDAVVSLGSFVEIEAIDETGSMGEEKLYEQCRHYMALLGIREEQLVAASYSDLLMQQ